MKNYLFNEHAIQSFRDNGYKSTASAVAEIIDNSIEAKADNIRVLMFEESKNTRHKRVDSIAIYDDGTGMSPETMKCALQFGGGTRYDNKVGMGRFGMGLPNASVSVCTKVTVYSWQNNKCFSSCLDIDKIFESKNMELEDPKECKLPKRIVDALELKLGDSGTIVFWENCDRVDYKKAKTIFNKIEDDLCRIYRHFLDNDNDYGERVCIKLIKPRCADSDRFERELLANDPLYLLTPTNTPGYPEDAINFLQNDMVHREKFFTDKGEGEVEIRVSITKPEVHIENSGKTGLLMEHLKLNQGISFVRACREIEHGSFGYCNGYDPRERWWGVEVSVPPVLDELFGVPNNKQTIKNMKRLDQQSLNELLQDRDDNRNLDDFLNSADGQKLSLRRWVNEIIDTSLQSARTEIHSRNTGRKAKINGNKKEELDPASRAMTQVIEITKSKSKYDKEANAKDADIAVSYTHLPLPTKRIV